MKKILITGANGFIGYSMKKWLDEKGAGKEYEYYYLDRFKKKIFKDNFYVLDLFHKNKIHSLLKALRPDLILDLIGLNDSGDITQYYRINSIARIRLLEAILSVKGYYPRVVTLGSAAEYGKMKQNELPVKETADCHPLNHYGISKLSGTFTGLFYHKHFGLKIMVARPFNILGAGMSENFSVPSFIRQIKELKKGRFPVLHVGNINTKRDFLHVRDVIMALFLILEKGQPGQIYNICRGESISIKTMINTILKIMGKDVKIKVDQKRIKKGDVPDSYGDNSRLKKLGWDITYSIEEALNDMIEDSEI
ncbi:MAG: GDP-mannose 4,6-dehydratase [Spirochaetes bacterium]|nr:GDP-mannose 4,6-dehydratase [Spirochaetota bacterium]